MPYKDQRDKYPSARRWRQTEKGRAARNAIAKRDRERHREKYQARDAVAYAIKTGKLAAQPCHCGAVETEAHHHLGYAPEHRLDVTWLCDLHHKAVHTRSEVPS